MSTADSTRPTGEQLAEEYRASRLRTAALLEGISADDEQRIVPTCPDWRVRDLVSHVNALAADLSAGRGPDGDTQAWVDQQVIDRADLPVSTQLEQWSESGAAFEETLRSTPQLKALVVDLISHEHDVAGAIGTQSDRSSSGVELVMSMMGRVFAKDLQEANLNAFRMVCGDRSWEYGEGDVELEVRGDLWEMFRLTGGRRSMAQVLASDHEGDMARYMTGLIHNPLPEVDIIE